MSIDGHTRIYGLIGFPVSHTRSPAMLNAAFDALGMNAAYIPFEVHPGRLADALKGLAALGAKGFNVTVPHKRAVMDYCDSVSEEAAVIGAVNTVLVDGDKLRGENTDGRGFVRALEFDMGFVFEGKTVFIMGAGGAGRAVGVMSAIRGAQGVRVADIDRGRAIDLADTINSKLRPGICRVVEPGVGELRAALEDVHIFVDATPLGLKPGDDASIDVAWINPGALVYDLVYNPPVTGLVSAARAVGMRAENGLGMLLHQGAIAFELWTGEEAPIEVMKDALGKALKPA